MRILDTGGKGMLKMDEINKIKKAYRDGNSINEIAINFGRSWETVKRIIEMPSASLDDRGRRSNKQRTVITKEVEEAITAYLDKEVQLKVHKKQRFTAAFIFKELRASGVYKGKIRQIQDAIKRLREEYGQHKCKSFLPLEFEFGTTAEFDHGECDLIVCGQRVVGYLFVCSIPGSALRYCQVFPVKNSEAWGEFHERAYRFFGGVFPVAIYDNDCVLVKQILGSERNQTRFSHALEEHYRISSRFCNPAAGNEKGSVENGVGYCRRNYLPGCQSFEDWQVVNKKLQNSCLEDIETGQHYKSKQPLKILFEEIANRLEPLFSNHSWRRWEEARVDSYQLVHVNSQSYSVPERYVGSNVRIGLGVFDIHIFNNDACIAQHTRRFGESGSALLLDHYLDQLSRKPRALWDCQAIKQHKFAPELIDVWKRLQHRYPSLDANRKFIEMLQLGRRYGSNQLIVSVREAIPLGIIEPTAIENILCSMISANSAREAEALRQQLQHLQFDNWTCNVDQYAQLVGGW
jgi:transposase